MEPSESRREALLEPGQTDLVFCSSEFVLAFTFVSVATRSTRWKANEPVKGKHSSKRQSSRAPGKDQSSLQSEYIENLQQQVYFLELELQIMCVGPANSKYI